MSPVLFVRCLMCECWLRKIRDMGGTYNEMQECLRNVFAQLGDECQLYTRAAEACDFEVIRTVCPVHEADSATGTAACLHRVSLFWGGLLGEFEAGFVFVPGAHA